MASGVTKPVTFAYEEAYETIADSLVRGDIGLLIGSGMSFESGIAVGSDMAKRMLRRAVLGPGHEDDATCPTIDKLAARYPFEGLAEYLTTKLNYQDFARWLRDEAGLGKAKPNDAHERLFGLRSLLGQRFQKMVFTTNFDNLIEKRFESDACCITTENLAELAEAREKGRVAVVHLHGSVSYPKSIVLGELELTSIEGPLFDLFRAALATDIFVLIGYSLADTNLRKVFFDVQRVANTRRGLKKRTFAVSPADGDPNDLKTEAGIAKAVWAQRGIEHLAVTASEFFGTLLTATDDFVMVKLREQVATALRVERETLDKMLESATKQFGVLEPKDLLMYLYYSLTPLETAS